METVNPDHPYFSGEEEERLKCNWSFLRVFVLQGPRFANMSPLKKVKAECRRGDPGRQGLVTGAFLDVKDFELHPKSGRKPWEVFQPRGHNLHF